MSSLIPAQNRLQFHNFISNQSVRQETYQLQTEIMYFVILRSKANSNFTLKSHIKF